MTAPGIRPEHTRALTRLLLIPEHAELVPGRRLRGETQRRVAPATDRDRRSCLVRYVVPLRRIAHVRVCEHAGNRAVAALIAELEEEPHLVFRDRPADADIGVPQLEQLAGS